MLPSITPSTLCRDWSSTQRVHRARANPPSPASVWGVRLLVSALEFSNPRWYHPGSPCRPSLAFYLSHLTIYPVVDTSFLLDPSKTHPMLLVFMRLWCNLADIPVLLHPAYFCTSFYDPRLPLLSHSRASIDLTDFFPPLFLLFPLLHTPPVASHPPRANHRNTAARQPKDRRSRLQRTICDYMNVHGWNGLSKEMTFLSE